MLRPTYLSILMIVLFSGLLLSSCDSYYFSRPQPVDRTDERYFPRAMRGDWHDISDNEETGADVILSDTEQTRYSIDQRRIWTFNQEEVILLDRDPGFVFCEEHAVGEKMMLSILGAYIDRKQFIT